VERRVGGGGKGVPNFDGRRLRAAREAARLTQRALAERIAVPENAIANWETGQRVPRVDRLAEIARLLDVRPTELTKDAGTPATLRQLRVDAGLLQDQVAAAAGLTRTKYSALERGEIASLSRDDARALARVLGVTEDEVRHAHGLSHSGPSGF
jgi:transcriptional regulator with XRE-family HTH domain